MNPLFIYFPGWRLIVFILSFIKSMRRPTSRPWHASTPLRAVMFVSSGSVISSTKTCLQWHSATLLSSCSLWFTCLEMGTLQILFLALVFHLLKLSVKFSFKLYHLKKSSVTLLSSKYSGRRREVKSNSVMYPWFSSCEVYIKARWFNCYLKKNISNLFFVFLFIYLSFFACIVLVDGGM